MARGDAADEVVALCPELEHRPPAEAEADGPYPLVL